jgi:hypothetical protein
MAVSNVDKASRGIPEAGLLATTSATPSTGWARVVAIAAATTVLVTMWVRETLVPVAPKHPQSVPPGATLIRWAEKPAKAR